MAKAGVRAHRSRHPRCLIAGLDPAIQPSFIAQSLDARVEPGHEAEQVESPGAGAGADAGAGENLLPLCSLIAGLDPAIQPFSAPESLDARVEPGHEAKDVEGLRAGAEARAGENLLPLFAWLSPGFPVGAYAYSHALEWAAEAGDIIDEATLAEWLTDILEHGAGRNDAILFACAHRAVTAADPAALADANELALAMAPSRELLLETAQQGRSFFDAVLSAWPTPRLAAIALDGEIAYPVAVGAAAAAHGMPLRPALEAFLLAFAQNLVSAAMRLAPIGQTSGMRIVARLAPAASRLAADCEALTLDDLGGCTFRADLGSFLHETQYTRLFRS